MDIKAKIEETVDKLKNDPKLMDEFKKDPVKAVESVLGVDLPDDVMDKVVDAVNWVTSIADEGDNISKLVEKNKSRFAGPELMGNTIGVLGLGATGSLVANACLAMDMNVIGFDPFMSVEAAWRLSREVIRAEVA